MFRGTVLAWRLCREAYATRDGEGARLYGGRWNSPGQPLVDAASTAALTVLEICVHLDLPPERLPDDHVLVTIDLGALPIEDVAAMPADPREFGGDGLREQRTPVLRVPSAIVPESLNVLLNPRHPEATRASITASRRFSFDRRLWPSV